MASSKRAAHRYALAVLDLATEFNQIDAVAADFNSLYNALKNSRELKNFLKSPVVNHEKKKTIVKAIFESKVTKPTMNFLYLITAKGREDLLPEIVDEFVALNEQRHNILNVGVDSAIDMTPAQKEQLTKHLEGITKKTVRLQMKTDASVKGGFVVRIGDTVWDASVRRQLELLWERFSGEN